MLFELLDVVHGEIKTSMHPDDITTLDGNTRERLRQTAMNDVYFMGKAILRYRKLVPHVHREPCAFFSNPPHKDIVYLAPRDHYKTTTADVSDSIRRITKRPDIRIMLANQSLDNASAILTQIEHHFENNRWFRNLFPEIIPPRIRATTWSDTEMLVPRDAPWSEPTIRAVGTGTKIESAHFDLLKLDDIVGRDHKNSQTLMKEAIDWLNYTTSLLVEPEVSERHLIGTRWKFDDVYAHAMDKMGFVSLIQKAIVHGPNGPEPLFPELISMKTLRQIIEQDPEQYALNYANDPYDTDQMSFKPEWLRYYHVAPDRLIRYKDGKGELHLADPGAMTIYCHVDPALGENNKQDPFALVVVGILSGPRVFVLETFKKRINPIQQIWKMLQIQETWTPHLFTVESNGYQKALKYYAEQESRRRGIHMNIEPIPAPPNKSKQARIRGKLQPFFSIGSVFMRSDMVELFEEYTKFGMTEDDHLMDALAQGPEVWKEPWDDMALRRYKRVQDELLNVDRGVTGYGI